MSRRSAASSRSRTLRPPTRMSPSVMSIIRLTIRIAVVLPQPDGPTSTQISPACTASDSAFTAGRSVVAGAAQHAPGRRRAGTQSRAAAVVLEAREHADPVDLDRDVADQPRALLPHGL